MEVGRAKKSHHCFCTRRNLGCVLPLDAGKANGRTRNAHCVAYVCAIDDPDRVEHIHRRTVGHSDEHKHAKPNTDTHRDAYPHACPACPG